MVARTEYDHLNLQHAHRPLLWAQTTPAAPGRLRVELSDRKGWVLHFRSPHPDRCWSPEQALNILRGFVSDRHLRGDGHAVGATRRA